MRDHLRDKSPFVFKEQGEQPVKNCARPVRVFTVRFEGAPITADMNGAKPLGVELTPGATVDGSVESKVDEVEQAIWLPITDSVVASDYVA